MDTKKLRQKILDLAIHGKLVPQDPNDEPASVLLERIRAEKERLIKEGKIKRSRKTTKTSDATCDEQEVPFEVPSGWVWCSLGEVNDIARGGSPRPIKDYLTNSKNGVNWIKIGDTTKDGKYINSVKEKIRVEGVIKSRMVHKGDFLLTNSMSFGRPYILNVDGCIHDGWLVISPIGKVYSSDFLYYLLSSSFALNQFVEVASGGVVSNLNSDKVADTVFPLPPFAEQLRIVEEVERWFKLIDIIEQGKTDLQSTIKQAKNKILDLAIHGKLVPQDPNDEPASELLKRINPKAEITCDNGHYPKLPSTWRVCSYKDIFTTISSRPFQIKQSEIKDKGKYPVVSQSLLYIEGYSDIECALKCDSSYIVFGDHTRIVKFIDFDFIVGADGVKIITSKINNKYAYFLLLYVSDKINNKGYSRHFSQIINYKYSLPPFAEQQRIVEKIDKLFTILKTIEENL